MTFSATQPDCMSCCLLSARNSLNVCGASSFMTNDSGGDRLKADTSLYWNQHSMTKSSNRHMMHSATKATMPHYAPF